MGANLYYAVQSRQQFYPIILYLATSKLSFLITSNLVLALFVLFGKSLKTIFLGNLRDSEVELLIDKAKYTITETCLALTIFRNELSASVLGLFGVLLFLKVFHWLAQCRLDYLDQLLPVPPTIYYRLSALFLVLFLFDVALTYYCMDYTISNGKSVLILFGFEFGVLVITILNLSSKYIIHIIDSRLPNGLVSKGLYTMLSDLICDGLRLVTYVGFFGLVFVNYGLPIHIVREVWMAFFTFQKRLSSFIKYIKLTANLDTRFPNATSEEMQAAGDCLICREPMETGKKLPCNHVFHLSCLRAELQHRQSCPLCRADIPIQENPVTENVPGNPPPPPDHVRVQPEVVVPAAGNHGNNTPTTNSNNNSTQVPASPSTATPSPYARVGSGRHHTSRNSRNTPTTFTKSTASVGAESLPCFYIVVADPSVNVHVEPDIASTVVRYVNKGVVVFIESSTVDSRDNRWLKGPDGWLLEYEQVSVYYARRIPALVPYDTTKLEKVVGNNTAESPLAVYSQLLAQPALPTHTSSAKKKVVIDWSKRYSTYSDSEEDIVFGDEDDEDGDSVEQMMQLQMKLSKLNDGLAMCQHTLSNMIEAKLQSATKSSRKSDAAMHLFNPEELDFGRASSASTIATHDIKSRSPSLGNDTVVGGASVEDASPLISNDLINNTVHDSPHGDGTADVGSTESPNSSSQKSMRELRAKYYEKMNSP